MMLRERVFTALAAILICAGFASAGAFAAAPQISVIQFPRQGATVANRRPVAGADFQDAVSKSRLPLAPRLLIDGVDVTDKSEINKAYIFYTPAADLAPGKHEIILKLEEKGGKEKTTVKWSFTISGQKPLRLAYPSPDSKIDTTRPTIGFDMSELPSDLDRKSLRLLIDGKDVTAKSDINEEYILYTAEKELAPGPHRVEVSAAKISGGGRGNIAWSFQVAGAAPQTAIAEAPEKAPATAGETKPADGTAPGTKARKNTRAASAVAGATRQGNSIAQGVAVSEALYGPPPETVKTVIITSSQTSTQTQAGGTAAASGTSAGEVKTEKRGPATKGFEYALETTYGFDNMAVGGQEDLSSQFSRNAYVYRLGLRTQTTLNTLLSKKVLYEPVFSINMRMEGTTDGDETESFWDLKKLTASLADQKKRINIYDIQPKYTQYTLTGQWLLGAEATILDGPKKFQLFNGSYKTPRAGRDVAFTGFRYAQERSPSTNIGFQYVTANIEELRTSNKIKNGVFSFNYEKRYKSGESRFEYAKSNYSGFGGDKAFRVESTYRNKKAVLMSSYENVGNFFRSEGGFASYGLVEFRSSMQYKVSSRLTTVLGFWRRTFREGGSHTATYPFMLRYTPFKSRPSTIFEYRYKMVYYDRNPSWKDTYTKNYDLMHKIGKHAFTFSFKDEHTERNASVDEDEQLFNLTTSSPVTKKTTLTYKLSKLDNSLYGPETKNTYGVSYELSDWSDMRLSLEKVNKVQPTLDRDTARFRFGKVNPDTNTEMSLELSQNKFLLYDETLLSMKYSLFY